MTSCLLVTHASRPFVEARASLNALESRFSAKGRLLDLPPFDTLPSVQEAVPFSGALTLWDVDRVARKPPVLVGEYDPGYKIQSAVFRGDQLLVLGEDRIEVLTPGFRQKTIEDPWLVGGHTICCDKRGFAYATSAPANAVLKIDVDAGKVVERIRLPDCYGAGYPLTESDDLRLHFVPTDLQPTHINSAVPCAEGLLVTLCIQGVVGVIDSAGQFREIVRGYRGCHGGRIDKTTGLLYFTDSAAGIVWFAEYETGQIASRIKLDSAWVHDADHIREDLFAVALSDHNRVDVIDRADGAIISGIDCHPFGASAMFVKTSTLPAAWRPKKMPSIPKGSSVKSALKVAVGRELLPDPLNPVVWMRFKTVSASISSSLHIRCDNAQYEYLAEGLTLTLLPGDYVFDVQMLCKVGEASAGLLDETDAWIVQLTFDASNSTRSTSFSIGALSSVTVVVAGHNSRRSCPVAVELKHLSLKCLTAELNSDFVSNETDDMAGVPLTGVHRRAEIEHLQAEINKRDALLKKTESLNNKTHDRLQSEINKRDALLKKTESLNNKTHDQLQSEINKRDALLKIGQGEVERMQAEINKRDALLKKTESLNNKTHDQLQSEINKRDALLKIGQGEVERMQAEINKRDALLKKTESLNNKTHDQLQSEINKRDELLKIGQGEVERMQAEINKRDALLKKTHDHLQAEVNTRDQMLDELQRKFNDRS